MAAQTDRPRCVCGCGEIVTKPGTMTRKCRGRQRKLDREALRAAELASGEPAAPKAKRPKQKKAPAAAQGARTVRLGLVEALRNTAESFRSLADAVEEEGRS